MDERAFIPRHAAEEIIDALTEARIVAILGPRQAGKSTLARSLATRGFAASFNTLSTFAISGREVGVWRGVANALARAMT